jgi:hypothetical protein
VNTPGPSETSPPAAPTKDHALRRELLRLAPLYVFLSLVALFLKIRVTGAWFSLLERNHDLLLGFEYTNNEQSRLLQFTIPELIHQLGLSIPDSYALARFLFVLAAFLTFHAYLRRWFSVGESLAGVLLVAVALPFSFMNDLQESAPLLMLVYVLALWSIREERPAALAIVLVIGALTNETSLILPLLYVFSRLEFSWRSILVRTGRAALIGAPALAMTAVIRYMTRDRPHLGGAYHWPDNIAGIWHDLHLPVLRMYRAFYLSPVFLFGALWVFALLGYKKKPLFVRRSLWLVPFFLVPHMITGIIAESRQMIPLGFILIPAALFALLPRETPADSSCLDSPSARSSA